LSQPVRPSEARAGLLRRLAGFGIDGVLVSLIVSLVYTPLPAQLAGLVFANDLFFHWDHFVMGPAVAWHHGMALGTDVYSQYGEGWPILLDAISPWLPLGHQNTIWLAMLYGCLHHVGLYVLLRAAVRSRPLAFGGTLAILATSLFSPLVAQHGHPTVLWQWPSLSVLRAPMDVWFFLCLLLHLRRPTATRAVAAGAIAGLGLWLETDTGIFLVGTLAVYGASRFVAAELGSRLPRAVAPAGPTFAASLVALFGVAVTGLAIASRGTIFSEPGAFLAGWIGGVINSSARGVGASYLTYFLRDHGAYLAPALAVLGIGLFAVCDTTVRLLQARATPASVFSGCLGLYALGRCTLFVWRTVPIRLTLAAIPIGVLVVGALAALRRPLAARIAQATGLGPRWLEPILPTFVVLAGVSLLLASPSFRSYPNLWQLARSGPPEPGLVLFPEKTEIAGLPDELRPVIRSIRTVIAEVRSLRSRGEPVAVLDPIKTLVYVETGAPPWRGDASLFLNTWTREDLHALRDAVERDGPEHVIFRSVAPSRAVADSWRALRDTLEQRYVPAHKLGVFERWDRR